MSGGGFGAGMVATSIRMGTAMFSSITSFFIGIVVLLVALFVTAVGLPYAGLMIWHRDNVQVGVDKATRFVKAEYRIAGAAWEGGTEVTADGFREGQTMTQKSLGTDNN